MISEDVILCIVCGRPVEPGRAILYDFREHCPECYSKIEERDLPPPSTPPAPPARRPSSEEEAVDGTDRNGFHHA